MRIGTYNMISQIYGANNTKKSKNTNSTGYASFKDEVSFSSMGKDMQTAKNALVKTPDVRESLVDDIKSRMDQGTYSVDTDEFADKLLAVFAAKKAY